MNYQPKILMNPTNHVVEFMYGGQIFIFQPKEEKLLEGLVANHALRFVNTGLVDVTEKKVVNSPLEPERELSKSELVAAKDFDKMNYRSLIKAASHLGKYKPGMKKREILEVLQGKAI